MTGSFAVAALAATLSLLPAAAAFAQSPAQPQAVAGAFLAAAQTQDRQAALQLLDKQVRIEFPSRSAAGLQGHAEGQPFVIGYLDGLFDARRGVSLDGGAPRGEAVRFLARDAAHGSYAIDVEVRGAHVVRLTVVQSEGDEAVASADPS